MCVHLCSLQWQYKWVYHWTDICLGQDISSLYEYSHTAVCCNPLQILADSDTSLMLSLKHPLPAVRNMAVEHLKEVLRKRQVGRLSHIPIFKSPGSCKPSVDCNCCTVKSAAFGKWRLCFTLVFSRPRCSPPPAQTFCYSLRFAVTFLYLCVWLVLLGGLWWGLPEGSFAGAPWRSCTCCGVCSHAGSRGKVTFLEVFTSSNNCMGNSIFLYSIVMNSKWPS